MRIKIILLWGTLFILSGTVAYACFRQTSSLLGVSLISVDEEASICQNREAVYEDNSPTVLSFQDFPVPCDSAARTFYLPVSGKPEWDPGALRLPDDSSWTDLKLVKDASFSKDKLSMAKEGTAYRLLFYNRKYYQTYRLIVTTLPVMTITTAQRPYSYDPDDPIGYLYTLTHMALFEAISSSTGSFSLTESQAFLKVWGNNSQQFPKKSYRMSLVKDESGSESNDLDLLGIRQDDDWILSSLFTDSTKIREPLAMGMWDMVDGKSEYHYSFSMKYVELILDGQYWGLYGLTYPVDAKGLGLKWDQECHDILFKTLANEKPALAEIDEAIELNKSSAGGVEIEYPDLKDRSQLWPPFRFLLETLTYWDEKDYREYFTECADTESIVDCWLFFQLAGFRDNAWQNQYFAARDSGDGNYMFYMVPGDFDFSLGYSYDENSPLTRTEKYDIDEVMDFTLGYRILSGNVDGSISMARENWNAARASNLTEESLDSLIDEMYGQLASSGVYLRDHERWPEALYMDGIQRIQFIKQYIQERLDFMDTYINAPDFGEVW